MDDPETPHSEIVDDDPFVARDALSAKFADLWWSFVLRGVLAAAVGIAALFWPTGSISVLLQLVGLLLVLDGGLTLLGLGRGGAAGGVGIGAICIIGVQLTFDNHVRVFVTLETESLNCHDCTILLGKFATETILCLGGMGKRRSGERPKGGGRVKAHAGNDLFAIVVCFGFVAYFIIF